MKTIKLSFVALATLVLGTFVFTGCSEEGSTVAPVDLQVLKSRIIDEGAFLAEFYEGIPWERRRTVVARDNRNTYVVTEIILEGDTRARGYLVKDEATGELLHFADVDRTGYVLETVNLITEEREIIGNINLHPNYGISNELDFTQIIDDVNNNNLGAYVDIPIYFGPIFGGRTGSTGCDPDTFNSTVDPLTGNESCTMSCNEAKHFLFIAFKVNYQTVAVDCDTLNRLN